MREHLPARPDRAARQLAVANGLPWPNVDEIFAATSTHREDAYEIADAIIAGLPALEQSLCPPGSEPAVARGLRLDALAHEALGFVMRHPGCAQRSADGHHSAHYRRFVIELRKRYADVTASEFADVLALPLGTLEGWMRGVHDAAEVSAAPNPTSHTQRRTTRRGRRSRPPLSIPDRSPAIAPVVTAGVLLAVHREALQRGLGMPSVHQIMDAMGASRSRAFEIKDAVVALLPTLVRLPGRPRTEPAPAPSGQHAALLLEALRFVMRHLGACRSARSARGTRTTTGAS
jgi:hypothetical protein